MILPESVVETLFKRPALRAPWPAHDAGDGAATECERETYYATPDSTPAADQTTADILVSTLVNWGGTHVFGMVGDGINSIMEAIRKRRDEIQFVGVRHEEAAAFMAGGFAKHTGRLGICIGTTGPGAIHLLNGQARGVQVDINADRIGLRYPTEIGLVGDVKATLEGLIPLIQRKNDSAFLKEAQSRMRDWNRLLDRIEQTDRFAPEAADGGPRCERSHCSGCCNIARHRRQYVFLGTASSPEVGPTPDESRNAGHNGAGTLVKLNGSSGVTVLGSHFQLAGPQAEMLLGMLPPIVHLQSETDRETLRWAFDRMRQELADSQPEAS